MGAGGRRANRRLTRAPAPLVAVASSQHPLVLPAISLAYAAALATGLLSLDELADGDPGPWFELLGASVLGACVVSTLILVRTAWRRQREGLTRRSIFWVTGAAAAALLGGAAIFALVESVEIAAVISGADVHLTRPVIESLPRPPGVKQLSERPGLADTESISEDFLAGDLKAIVPFYEAQLPKQSWVEDPASVGSAIVRFTRGAFVLSIAIDPPSSGYSVTVDRVNPNLFGTPSPTATPSASPSP
jgi:hypothetical protein